MTRAAIAFTLLAALAACSSGEEVAVADDPSKLSAELEARAAEIEARADAAVAAAEQEAEGELAQLAEEAEAAERDAAQNIDAGDAG